MKTKIYLLLLGVMGVLLYGLTLRGVYGNPNLDDIRGKLDESTMPFELSPERGRYLLTYSIAENKSFALSKGLADAASPDVGYHEGKFYVFFPPGISILAAPFYLWGKMYNLGQVFAFGVISLVALVNMLLIFTVARKMVKLPDWPAALSAIIFGFGSTSWSYAISLYQHHVSTFLILSSLFAVWKYRQNQAYSWLGAAWVWTAYGLGIWIDYPNALLMLPVMIYLALSSVEAKKVRLSFRLKIRPAISLTAGLFGLLVLAHGYYNSAHFGSWNKLSGGLPHYEIQEQTKSASGENYQVKTTEAEKNPVNFFREENLPFGVYTLISSLDRGLLLYSPIYALAIFGIAMALKRMSLEVGVILGVIAGNFFLYSSWGDPWGGWAFGPRYLIPSLSLLAIFVGYWLYHEKYQVAARLTVLGLFAYSAGIALLGALTTSAIPPKIEGDFLKMKYNFLLNLDYLRGNKSSSFVYNTWIHQWLSLDQFYVVVFCSVVLIFSLFLFLPKKITAHDN